MMNTESIEPELQGGTPRQVSLTTAGRVLRTLAVVLAAMSILGTSLAYVKTGKDAELLRRAASEGTTASGEVTGVRRQDDHTEVGYRFTVEGVTLQHGAQLSHREAAGLAPGSPVRVHYLSSDPKQSWLRDQPDTMPFFVPALIFAMFAVPATMIFLLPGRQRRLLEEGRPAKATITACKRVGTGHQHGYRMKYEFRTLSGKVMTGSKTNKKPREVGATMTILYDRDEPQKSIAYPTEFFKVTS